MVISLFRMPFAAVASVVILLVWSVFWLLWVVFECALVAIALVPATLILSRKALATSFLGQFPNFVRVYGRCPALGTMDLERAWEDTFYWYSTRLALRRIWDWALDPEVGAEIE